MEIWNSVHLYFEGDAKKYIKDVFIPIVDEMKSTGMFEVFFYIQYADPKKHLRFRFKTLYNSQETPLSFLRSRVGEGLLVTEYYPEVERYGGKELLELAEHQFCLSSQLCLEIIRNDNSHGYGQISTIGKAIILNLALLHSFDYNEQDVARLFKTILNGWIGHFEINDSQTCSEGYIESFQRTLGKHPELVGTIKSYWQALKERQEFEECWINDWISDMSGVHHMLNIRVVKYPSQIIQNHTKLQKLIGPFDFNLFPSLCDSYLHMNNNRLGVNNYDEAYIAYIIYTSLKNRE